MAIKVVLDNGAKISRAHPTDAGMDLCARETQKVYPHDCATFDTGVHIGFEPGTFGQIVSKSGLNVKHGIVCCGGTIDQNYTGSIVVKVYNLSDDPYVFNAGDKVAQLIIMKCETPNIEYVDSLEATDRGDNGFGSSGK